MYGVWPCRVSACDASPFDRERAEMKVVLANGCFDILHVGHIETLKYARHVSCEEYYGHHPRFFITKVIVGLNSDESVRRLKGEGRPFNDQNYRKMMLEAIRYVDEIIIFDEDTPYSLIKRLKPDVIVKGGDYHHSEVIGSDISRIKIAPHVEGYSTSKILEKL